MSAIEGSPAELVEVGVVAAVGFLQLWVSRLGRGVWLILLAPLCNTQTQPPFPPPPSSHPQLEHSHSGVHDVMPPQVCVNSDEKNLFTSVCQSRWKCRRHDTHRQTSCSRGWLPLCLARSYSCRPRSLVEWRPARRSVFERGGKLLGACASLGWQMGWISLPTIWRARHRRDAASA